MKHGPSQQKSLLSSNLASSPKHRGSFCFHVFLKLKGTWLSLKGISYLQVIGNGTGNGLPNIRDTFAESFQLEMAVLHQSVCTFKRWSIKCKRWLGKIYIYRERETERQRERQRETERDRERQRQRETERQRVPDQPKS